MILGRVDSAKTFREKAREFFFTNIKPDQIFWDDQRDGGQSFFQEGTAEADGDSQTAFPPLMLPRLYAELVKVCGCHRSGRQWTHLYSLLWKIKERGPEILAHFLDSDVHALLDMQKNIKRDIHKMHAFVRFQKVEQKGDSVFTAWYEPDHFILELATPFFARRFANMNWIIATPHGTAAWSIAHKKLEFTHAPQNKNDFIGRDNFEEFWLSYYKNIFNPARVKIKAMKKEMPVRFWKNLPEAQLIPRLLNEAPKRVDQMHTKMKKQKNETAEPYLPQTEPERTSFLALKEAAKTCQGCALFSEATQTVFGRFWATSSHTSKENPLLSKQHHHTIMVVGEQPGDQEDTAGEPFVGPAGQLLQEVLSAAQSVVSEKEALPKPDVKIYLTNAVKHFYFERKGKARLHKSPKASFVSACRPWLDHEVKAIKPSLIVCLGSTAVQSVLGYPLSVTRERGKVVSTRFEIPALITFHPSYLLRIPNEEDRLTNKKHFQNDLEKALCFTV